MARKRKKGRTVVIGLDELSQALDRVQAAVSGHQLAQALLIAAEDVIVPEAAKRAERGRTGDLADSITAEIQESSNNARVVAGTNLFYGPFVELGVRPHTVKPSTKEALTIGGNLRASADHPGISPTPFLRPAYDENEKQVKTVITQTLRKSVNKAAR